MSAVVIRSSGMVDGEPPKSVGDSGSEIGVKPPRTPVPIFIGAKHTLINDTIIKNTPYDNLFQIATELFSDKKHSITRFASIIIIFVSALAIQCD